MAVLFAPIALSACANSPDDDLSRIVDDMEGAFTQCSGDTRDRGIALLKSESCFAFAQHHVELVDHYGERRSRYYESFDYRLADFFGLERDAFPCSLSCLREEARAHWLRENFTMLILESNGIEDGRAFYDPHSWNLLRTRKDTAAAAAGGGQ